MNLEVFPIMSIKDKLMMYIYKKSCIYEQQKKDMDYRRKYYPMDSLDMYETMRQDIEIECYENLLSELYQLVLNCK